MRRWSRCSALTAVAGWRATRLPARSPAATSSGGRATGNRPRATSFASALGSPSTTTCSSAATPPARASDCDRVPASASTEARGPSDARRRQKAPAAAAKARSTVTEAAPSASDAAAWYEELRERYRPERLRVLLVAESPPDPGDGERRFFYSPELRADNLYRGVAQALYGKHDEIDILDKPAVLDRIRADGFWLIDAVNEPINKLGSAARARAIAAGVPPLAKRCVELAPELGVIIRHGKVYAAGAQPLREAGVVVLRRAAALPARELARRLHQRLSASARQRSRRVMPLHAPAGPESEEGHISRTRQPTQRSRLIAPRSSCAFTRV